MELETLFTDQKWNILKNLSNEKFSPLQLATKSHTTIANISQQLRLLEAAHLVQKEKIPNRERGKPRTLFSLTDDYAYLISTMEDFAEKRLLKLTEHHKAILKIWYLDEPELHYHLEKLYWKLEWHLNQIEGIVITRNGATEVIIVSDKMSKKIENVEISKERTIKVSTVNSKEFVRKLKKAEEMLVLYDPSSKIINIQKKLE
jgi:predicted transcriptional regulator